MNTIIALVAGLIIGWLIHLLIERAMNDGDQQERTSTDSETTSRGWLAMIPVLLVLVLGVLLIGRACVTVGDQFGNPLTAILGGDGQADAGENDADGGDFVGADVASEDVASEDEASENEGGAEGNASSEGASADAGEESGDSAETPSDAQSQQDSSQADAATSDAQTADDAEQAQADEATDAYPVAEAGEDGATASSDEAYPVADESGQSFLPILTSGDVDPALVPTIDTYGVPTFVGPDLIIVGLSAPNAEIEVRVNNVLYGTTTSDAEGNWLVQGTVAGAAYEIIAYAVTSEGLIPSEPVILDVPK